MPDPQPGPDSKSGQAAQRRRRAWEVGASGRRLVIIHRRDVRPGDEFQTNPPGMRSALTQWISDSFTLRTVMQMYEAVTGQSVTGVMSMNDPDLALKPRLEEAFRRGELLVLEMKRTAFAQPEAEKEEKKKKNSQKSGGPPVKEKTWIEFRVVWPDGEPAKDVRYRLKITDGSVRTGSLDDEGSVRVTNIDPGSCDFTLVDVDGRCWKSV